MQSMRSALADSRLGILVAVLFQAGVFALSHAYQGVTGVIGAFFSGLVYGAIVMAVRGNIWPAILAHGIGNTISLFILHFEATS